MIARPHVGQRVQLWYGITAKRRRGVAPPRVPVIPAEFFPHHGQLGTVNIVGRGKPRNHGILLDNGEQVGVPCGNLRPPPETVS